MEPWDSLSKILRFEVSLGYVKKVQITIHENRFPPLLFLCESDLLRARKLKNRNAQSAGEGKLKRRFISESGFIPRDVRTKKTLPILHIYTKYLLI